MFITLNINDGLNYIPSVRESQTDHLNQRKTQSRVDFLHVHLKVTGSCAAV